MLKNKIMKRILLVLSGLFIIFIIYIFPQKDKEINTLNYKQDLKDTIIYLKDKNNYIARISIYTKETDSLKKIREIISYLTIGSPESNYLKKEFTPTIPENTKLLSVSIDKSLAKLNFSKEFLNIKEGEDNVISSLIYSITSIEGIKEISIYIEGNLLDKMPISGNKIPPILNRSFGINNIYNITNIKGTAKTTIYYLSKIDDYYYYVPLTLINNNKNEKMDIIINELASKVSYQTGLISYIKASKDLDYKINANVMEVNIKKELFNYLNSSNLLESTIYSMNLSIKDNYENITKVVYITDNLQDNYIYNLT